MAKIMTRLNRLNKLMFYCFRLIDNFRSFLWKLILISQGAKIGSGVKIHHTVQIVGNPNRLIIDDGVKINNLVMINCEGGVIIGSNTTISSNVVIHTTKLQIINGIKTNKHLCESVEIGSNVWIACNVIVLPGARIADFAIISCQKVINK